MSRLGRVGREVPAGCANSDVTMTVAVEVAKAADRCSEAPLGCCAVDGHQFCAGCTGEGIGRARRDPAARRADDQLVQRVAIDVCARSQRVAEFIPKKRTVVRTEQRTVEPRIHAHAARTELVRGTDGVVRKRVSIDVRKSGQSATEGVAGRRTRVRANRRTVQAGDEMHVAGSTRDRLWSARQVIGEAIPVDVADARDARAELIARGVAVDRVEHQPVVGQGAHRSALGAVVIVTRCANDDVATVGVECQVTGQGRSEAIVRVVAQDGLERRVEVDRSGQVRERQTGRADDGLELAVAVQVRERDGASVRDRAAVLAPPPKCAPARRVSRGRTRGRSKARGESKSSS